jgi:hypothetical protein
MQKYSRLTVVKHSEQGNPHQKQGVVSGSRSALVLGLFPHSNLIFHQHFFLRGFAVFFMDNSG